MYIFQFIFSDEIYLDYADKGRINRPSEGRFIRQN